MSKKLKALAPILRFPKFADDWQEQRIDSVVNRVSQPVEVNPTETYREIGRTFSWSGHLSQANHSGGKPGKQKGLLGTSQCVCGEYRFRLGTGGGVDFGGGKRVYCISPFSNVCA